MRHYTTLFDSNYLARGLVLYESLEKHSSEPFRLHVLAMDEACGETLRALNLPQMLVVDLATFECARPEMAVCRGNRTWQEYCWTCASNFTAFVMLQMCDEIYEATYLDADMMFFSDPHVIFDEIGDRSIAVIPHRLIPEKKHLEVNGKFNVSWVTFKKTPRGRECLTTWAEQCRERCSATVGCGDQLYLDAWPAKYGDDLCVIAHIGAGLAPWNVANYTMCASIDETLVGRIEGVAEGYPDNWLITYPLVFYHYHEFKELPEGGYQLTNYELRSQDIELIYRPYIQAYERAKAQIEALQPA